MSLESYPEEKINGSNDGKKVDYSCTPSMDLFELRKNNPNDPDVRSELEKRSGSSKPNSQESPPHPMTRIILLKLANFILVNRHITL